MQLGGENIIYSDLSYKINGLLFKTHRELGRFRKEKEYGDFLENLLKIENIKYVREYRIKNEQVRNIVDFIIDDKMVLELKSIGYLHTEDFQQTKCYLSALNLKLGLLINFRHDSLIIKRVINSDFK